MTEPYSDGGDGRHVPLVAYDAANQILVSRNSHEPLAATLGEAFVLEDGVLNVASGGGGAAKIAVFTKTAQAGSGSDDNLLFSDLVVYDSSGTDITEDDTTFTLDTGTAYVNEAGIYLVDMRVDLSAAVTGGAGKDVAIRLGAGRDPSAFVAYHLDGATDGQVFRVYRHTEFVVDADTVPAQVNSSIERLGASIGTWGGTSFDVYYRITKLG